MKTAISLPDAVFDEAEHVAHRLGITRSEFYAQAVAALLDRYRGERVTEALNRVYAEQPAKIDPALAQMQFTSLSQEKW